MAPVVAFVGSRAWPFVSVPGSAALAPALVGSVLAAGRSVVVGCCVGADAAVVAAVLAAFGPGGVGAVGPSCVPVVSLAAAAGAAVSWWAGGAPSLPPLARLARRSRAVVAAAVAGGPGSGLVALVGAACPASVSPARRSSWWAGSGSGSWSAVACAVASGLPVVVFGAPSLPAWPGGSWVPAAASGPWASGSLWVPQPPLFGAPAGPACHNVAVRDARDDAGATERIQNGALGPRFAPCAKCGDTGLITVHDVLPEPIVVSCDQCALGAQLAALDALEAERLAADDDADDADDAATDDDAERRFRARRALDQADCDAADERRRQAGWDALDPVPVHPYESA